MRILFFGTPEFANRTLERLIDSEHEIVGVIAQPDRPAGRGRKLTPPPTKVTAEKAGIPVFQPEKIKTDDIWDMMQKDLVCDVAVVVAYGQILPKRILGFPKFGCLNIHASILPKYRGAAPIQWAIVNGEKKTGVTIMQLDEGMDTGPIVSVREADILEDDDANSLFDLLSLAGAELLVETLEKIEAEQKVESTPQNNEAATHAPLIKKEDALIDWKEDVVPILCKIRGFIAWPIAQTKHGKEMIKITGAEPVDPDWFPETWKNDKVPVGMVVDQMDGRGFVVKAGNGLVMITKLRIPGKKEMDGWSAINGGLIEIGDQLE